MYFLPVSNSLVLFWNETPDVFPIIVCCHYWNISTDEHASVVCVIAVFAQLVVDCKTRGARWTDWASTWPPRIRVSLFFCFLFCMHSFVKQNRDAISRRSSINSIQSAWVITLRYNLLLLVSSILLSFPWMLSSPLFCLFPLHVSYSSSVLSFLVIIWFISISINPTSWY